MTTTDRTDTSFLANTIPGSMADFAKYSFLLRYQNPATRNGYQLALDQWFDWCWGRGIDPLDAKRLHIEAWCRCLEVGWGGAKPNTQTTVATKLHALAGFYKHAVIDEHIDKDPMLAVQRPRVPRISSTNWLSRAELFGLLAAAEYHSPRAYALFHVLGLNGLRISEALDIDIEHLGKTRGYLWASIRRRKNDKQQRVSFSIPTMHAVETYIGARTEGPLFITSTGKRLIRQGAAHDLTRLCKQIGVKRRITPHSLRHTFATLALDAGVSERDLQHSGGWSDLRMVPYYDHGGDKPERNATHKLTPFVLGAA